MKERGQLTFSSLYREMKKSGALTEISRNILPLFKAAACFLSGQEASGISTFIKLMAEESIVDAGTRIVNSIKQQGEINWNDHVLRMRGAYAAICFTSFFDTLRQILPKEIYDDIALQDSERKQIWDKAEAPETDVRALDRDIMLPELVFNCDRVYAYLEILYGEMANNLQHFVYNLAFHEEAQEKDIRTFEEQFKKLPKAAVESFKSQYLLLCSACPEFYIYIQFGKEREIAEDSAENHQELLSVAMRTEAALTTGLYDLNRAICASHEQYKTDRALELAQSLAKKYQKALYRPIVETTKDEKLRFPLIGDSFIPQKFRLLPYTGKERLEQQSTWDAAIPEIDMDAFWAKYLFDIDSVERLLLILGEPGGGKSLLTEVLAAQLSSEGSLAVRIPLRASRMEEPIDRLVCDQINKDGDPVEEIEKLRWLTENLKGEPITLLFDGYDEVQQATGAAYRNFLNELKEFQLECLQKSRPVRIIITSRLTLIDKADIPRDTLVMKLEEFDKPRQNKWIEKWNQVNHTVFTQTG